MNWDVAGITFAFMIMGYLIGSINNAVILTKALGLEDPRTKGSGNAGATNTVRNYGVKIGASVFVLDILKTVIAMLIPFLALGSSKVIVPLVGFAVVVGHIWPIFFGFKGGKGAASLLGFIIMINWVIALIGAVLFILLVLKTKKISLGSIVVPFILILVFIGFNWTPHMTDEWCAPIANDYIWWLVVIVFTLTWLIVVYKHKDNIKRLMTKTERNFTLKK